MILALAGGLTAHDYMRFPAGRQTPFVRLGAGVARKIFEFFGGQFHRKKRLYIQTQILFPPKKQEGECSMDFVGTPPLSPWQSAGLPDCGKGFCPVQFCITGMAQQ
jgi:hypothetical protein